MSQLSAAAEAVSPETLPSFDVDRLRADFPILHQEVNGKPLCYLDNAATAQKPRSVIEAVEHYYTWDNANVHRGLHTLSERATDAYEGARESVRAFLNARSAREIVFTRGCTEAINLVASSFGERLREGDEIILTTMEHHANIVPWQLLRDRRGVVLRIAPVNEAGELDLEGLRALISPRTRLVALSHISNVLGTVNPVDEVIALAHQADIPVLLDGAQSAPHQPVDVAALDCDFFTFSSHKLFGPTGIGVLYGKEAWLDTMPPYQGGGDMIEHVSFERTTFNELPLKFEAGTPNIAGGIGLAAAIDYLNRLDWTSAQRHEQALLEYATQTLEAIPGLQIIGRAHHKAAVISFVIEGAHAYDLATLIDQHGVAVRSGHHCAMPLMAYYNVPATTRASFAFYNTFDEIDRLGRALEAARRILV